ncbi:hypothetical protein PVA38_10465 [Streptococcus pneumoniae D39]|nr:hypothetical protein PVA38_10465 [Streptococcus pneumoniae D39]
MPCLLYTSPAHETVLDLVCRLLLEKKKKNKEVTVQQIVDRTYTMLVADIS